MKAVFFVPDLMHGGIERTITYLAEYFAHKGVDTTIFSISNYIFYDIDSSVKVKTLNVPLRGASKYDSITRKARQFIGTRMFFAKETPDVILCFRPIYIEYLNRIGVKKRAKIITSERSNPLFDSEDEKKIKKMVFSDADGIIFQTHRARDCFDEEIRKKGIVIPNAVGNPLAYEIKAADVPKKKFSAVGRLAEQKDYPTMLRAFAEFDKKHADYTCEIFGKGDDLRSLTELSKALGIEKKVIFRGIDKEALRILSDSCCYLLSSAYEGMPNTLMEAMGIGLPCISSDCPFGPGELIANGENGLLFPVGDSHAMAEAMCRMVEDRALAEKCGRNAAKILETHKLETIAEQYYQYILSVVKKA